MGIRSVRNAALMTMIGASIAIHSTALSAWPYFSCDDEDHGGFAPGETVWLDACDYGSCETFNSRCAGYCWSALAMERDFTNSECWDDGAAGVCACS
jgi:hypothetical protein